MQIRITDAILRRIHMGIRSPATLSWENKPIYHVTPNLESKKTTNTFQESSNRVRVILDIVDARGPEGFGKLTKLQTIQTISIGNPHQYMGLSQRA